MLGLQQHLVFMFFVGKVLHSNVLNTDVIHHITESMKSKAITGMQQKVKKLTNRPTSVLLLMKRQPEPQVCFLIVYLLCSQQGFPSPLKDGDNSPRWTSTPSPHRDHGASPSSFPPFLIFPLPFIPHYPLPCHPPFPTPFPVPFRGAVPLNPARGLGSAVSSPSGVGGGAHHAGNLEILCIYEMPSDGLFCCDFN